MNNEIVDCWKCGNDFEWDDNKSLYAGDDRYGKAKTICPECEKYFE